MLHETGLPVATLDLRPKTEESNGSQILCQHSKGEVSSRRFHLRVETRPSGCYPSPGTGHRVLTLAISFFFSLMEDENPALIFLLLAQAGDIETNPGPQTLHTLNVLQFNIQSIKNKKLELQHFLHTHNIHIATIQETHLTSKTKTPIFPNYTSLREDSPTPAHGLLTLIHKSINFTNTTKETKQKITPDPITNTQSIKIKLQNREIQIINMYLPPVSPLNPVHLIPNLHELNNSTNTIITADMNAHHTLWLNTHNNDHRGNTILEQLYNFNILNNTHKPTRSPYNRQSPTSPDVTLCTPNLAPTTTWDTITDLTSDHLPILIKHTINHPITKPHKRCYTNYKKADWPNYTQHIENKLTDFTIDNFHTTGHAINHFTKIIKESCTKYIPKGYRQNYNPNYTEQIKHITEQRNSLRSNINTRHNQNQITNLNDQIKQLHTQKQTENWNSYIQTLNHKTNSTQLWRTLRKIHTSHTQPPPTHESLKTPSNSIATPRQQCNILIKHFADISNKPTDPRNRTTNRKSHNLKIDREQHPPFTINDTKNAIAHLKNSKAMGPDSITNYHLKHLGPSALQALTDIYNKSWLNNDIPPIWKKATIIPILKPNKPPTQASSYRPISLISTIAKTLEKLILNRTKQSLPISSTQHGFKPGHSTSTLLTNLTQNILTGFNQNPPHRTILVTIDINKAFDTVPRHILTEKIINTRLHPNDKKWIINYISHRQAKIQIGNHTSKYKQIKNGVPQGAILSPSLFNLFTHDLPPSTPNTNINSYADDITIHSQHPKIETATNYAQQHINHLQRWLNDNNMSASASKSTVTLLTPDRRESNTHPLVTLNNTPLPLNKTPTILGLTLDTHMTFSQHTQNIKTKAYKKTNALKTLANTTFGQHKETLNILYKQFIRSTLNYASTSWYPPLSATNLQHLQKAQNNALRVITGCLPTTPIQHLHEETKILPLNHHLDMIGTQFLAKTSPPQHPCHNLNNPTATPRLKKTTPSLHYTQIIQDMNPNQLANNSNKHIHTTLTERYMQNRPINHILREHPPEIHKSETQLPRKSRVTLSRLRTGHHPALNHYNHKINKSPTPFCLRCNTNEIDTTTHLIEHCPTLTQTRNLHNIHSVRDLWSRPVDVVAFLSAAHLV